MVESNKVKSLIIETRFHASISYSYSQCPFQLPEGTLAALMQLFLLYDSHIRPDHI